ncbi:MAG: group 1 truncated hemoglobin [Oligoflexales bacterium]|nr:group 1 truncated hemoglobin [Oligoflexales bacterium]
MKKALEESLYKKIGTEMIAKIISDFYEQAFVDPIIGHFFFNKDQQSLILKQINFTEALLGADTMYLGQPLLKVHKELAIRRPHFMRRQLLMQQVMQKYGLEANLVLAWLEKENQLQSLILPKKAN